MNKFKIFQKDKNKTQNFKNNIFQTIIIYIYIYMYVWVILTYAFRIYVSKLF